MPTADAWLALDGLLACFNRYRKLKVVGRLLSGVIYRSSFSPLNNGNHAT